MVMSKETSSTYKSTEYDEHELRGYNHQTSSTYKTTEYDEHEPNQKLVTSQECSSKSQVRYCFGHYTEIVHANEGF